jgi:hypothetical protein
LGSRRLLGAPTSTLRCARAQMLATSAWRDLSYGHCCLVCCCHFSQVAAAAMLLLLASCCRCCDAVATSSLPLLLLLLLLPPPPPPPPACLPCVVARALNLASPGFIPSPRTALDARLLPLPACSGHMRQTCNSTLARHPDARPELLRAGPSCTGPIRSVAHICFLLIPVYQQVIATHPQACASNVKYAPSKYI